MISGSYGHGVFFFLPLPLLSPSLSAAAAELLLLLLPLSAPPKGPRLAHGTIVFLT